MTVSILVVDDSEFDRYIARRRLERCAGVNRVVTLASGTELLDYLGTLGTSDEQFVVLLDINMPELDGFHTLQHLTERLDHSELRERLIVLMYTSSDDATDRERAADFDLVAGYVVKPMGPDEVALVMRAADVAGTA